MAKSPKSESVRPDTLTLISRLLALQVVNGLQTDEAVSRLGAVGFDDATISQLLGITDSTVRGIRFRRAKKPAKKGKAR